MKCMNLCNCVIQGKATATLDGVQYGEKMVSYYFWTLTYIHIRIRQLNVYSFSIFRFKTIEILTLIAII